MNGGDWINVPLAVDTSALRNMSSNFRGRSAAFNSGDVWTILALLAITVAILWLLSRMAARQERRSRLRHPGKLFRSLCRTHQLTWPEQRLLRRFAHAIGLRRQPALVFLQPQCFDNPQLQSLLGTRDAAQLLLLRERLFAEPASADSSDESGRAATASAADSAGEATATLGTSAQPATAASAGFATSVHLPASFALPASMNLPASMTPAALLEPAASDAPDEAPPSEPTY